MKKLLTTLTSLIFALFVSANANAASVGVSVSVMDIEGDGKETVGGTNANTGGSSSETAEAPSIFIETSPSDSGWVVGLDWIPASAEFVNQSKTQTNVTTAAGATESKTQKVAADLDNHITFYIEKSLAGGFYAKAGIIHVDITTNESIGTGAEYGDTDLFGRTFGVGYRYDMGNLFMKLEASMSDYDEIELTSSSGNRAEGDIDVTAGRLAIGYSF